MPPPPPKNLKNSMKNCVMQSTGFFVCKKISNVVLLFAKCQAFCIEKLHVTQSVMLFVYKLQLQNFHENPVT